MSSISFDSSDDICLISSDDLDVISSSSSIRVRNDPNLSFSGNYTLEQLKQFLSTKNQKYRLFYYINCELVLLWHKLK